MRRFSCAPEPTVGAKRASRRDSLRFFALGSLSTDSRDSTDSREEIVYKLVLLGGKGTGKTAIISQFLYDEHKTDYKETLEEMYRGDFEIQGNSLTLNILDTGGNYVYDFPSMVRVSLSQAQAFIIVFSVGDIESFNEAGRLRDLVMSIKGPDAPIVIVGNKIDADRVVEKEETEAIVELDWENGYVECSAKQNINIQEIFKEVLKQTKTNLGTGENRSSTNLRKNSGVDISATSTNSSGTGTPVNMRRRQSLPQVPAYLVRRPSLLRENSNPPPSLKNKKEKKSGKNQCKVS